MARLLPHSEAAFAAQAPLPARTEPDPVAPVRLQGRMTPNGYQAENSAWKPFLTYPDKRLGTRADGSPRLAGRDPMQIPIETLRKAGHPKRSTAALVRALVNPNAQHTGNEEGDPIGPLECIRGYRDIPAYCDTCAGSAHLRRKCATIDCPFWAFRTGRNPHNPKRGVKPQFGGKKSPMGAEIRDEAEAGATSVAEADFQPQNAL